MRMSLPLLAAVLAAGCGGSRQPVQLTAPVPAPATQTLNCVRNQLDRMAFEVAPGAPAGTVTGLRTNEPPWYLRWIGYTATVDQITASVDQGQLRVVAMSSDPDAEGDPAEAGSLASADAARSARQVLAECGAG